MNTRTAPIALAYNSNEPDVAPWEVNDESKITPQLDVIWIKSYVSINDKYEYLRLTRPTIRILESLDLDFAALQRGEVPVENVTAMVGMAEATTLEVVNLLELGVVKWQGPLFDGLPCSADGIRELPDGHPLVAAALVRLTTMFRGTEAWNGGASSPDPKSQRGTGRTSSGGAISRGAKLTRAK